MQIFRTPSRISGLSGGQDADVAQRVVEAAVQAPSVHNTQPWLLRLDGPEVSLRADPSRQLRVADPSGREMLISCGAAVFSCRVALRRLGFVAAARVLPAPDDPLLVARIRWTEQVAPVDYELQLGDAIGRRRTHRGGFDPGPVPAEVLSALAEEAALEGARLRFMDAQPRRVALAALVQAAEQAIRLDRARAEEQAAWAPPPDSSRSDGVPPTAYPAAPERTDPDFPARDFASGHGWGMPAADQDTVRRSAGVVAILTTNVDQPRDWVAAGQALQRVLLCATASGLAAALHSQPLEFPALREFIRIQLSDSAHPQLIMRLGLTGQTAVSIRRPVADILL